MTARHCPRCPEHELVDYPVDGGPTVDFCPSCQGIWCDAAELAELVGEPLPLAVLPIPFGDQKLEGPPCPACGESSALLARQSAREEEQGLVDCPSCGGTWLDGGQLARLREVMRRRARERQPPPRPRPSAAPRAAAVSGDEAAGGFDNRLPFDVPLVNAWALPIAFGLALLFNATSIKVLLYPFQILVHELGHAVTAWLSGRLALPLPMGVTFWSGRSTLVGLVVLALLGGLAYLGAKERRHFVLAVALVLIPIQLYLTWGISSDRSEMWAIFGGIGGELLISAFLVAAFYYRGPKRMRWDFWRYVVLVPAACAFTLQVLLWQEVGRDMSRMPIGSALAGTRDGTGDLERLMGVYGWTQPEILAAYDRIAFLCVVVLLGHYVYFAARAWLLKRTAQ